MPRRPEEGGPEPEGGGPADRLRQHLDARFPEDELPDAAPDEVLDAAAELGDEAPQPEDAPAAPVDATEPVGVPDENLVAPDDPGESPEASWPEEEWSESEDQQQ
jgi:hypothetical protein